MEDLRDEWRRLYRSAPPLHLSRDLLQRGIAHRMQEEALGGLSSAAQRQLAAVARSLAADGKQRPITPAVKLKPGTTLVRDWRGRTHTVIVQEKGFEHDGKHHASLTQIAQRITRAHWSGPRLFSVCVEQRETPAEERPTVNEQRQPSPSSQRGTARRCAIYTRKSSDERLDQVFNSLDAQREACEAYVSSQRHEGWILLPTRYDDGGLSGGTLERPGLQRLLADILTAIVDGQQPAELSAAVLLQECRHGLPLDWQQQRDALGFR